MIQLNPEFILASEVRLIKLPPPWSVFGEADRQEFLEENVYPKWDKEKEANKIVYESLKEMFTPEQKARWEKRQSQIKKSDKDN